MAFVIAQEMSEADVFWEVQVEFRLAKPGLMKDFAGTWRVQPFTQHTLDSISNSGQPKLHQNNPWYSLTSTLSNCKSLSPSAKFYVS